MLSYDHESEFSCSENINLKISSKTEEKKKKGFQSLTSDGRVQTYLEPPQEDGATNKLCRPLLCRETVHTPKRITALKEPESKRTTEEEEEGQRGTLLAGAENVNTRGEGEGECTRKKAKTRETSRWEQVKTWECVRT